MRTLHRQTRRTVAAVAAAVLLLSGCAASGYDPGPEPTLTDDYYTPEPEPTEDYYTPAPEPTQDSYTPAPVDDAAASLAEADQICAGVVADYQRYKSGSAGSDPVAMGVATAQLMADAAAQLQAVRAGEFGQLAQLVQERSALTGQLNAAMDEGSYERFGEAAAALDENSALLLDEATALGLGSCAQLAGL